MRKIPLMLWSALALAVLGAGCATKPLTAEQQLLREARASCTELTRAMIGPEYGNDELAWRWYFERCMEEKGYTPEQLREMWY